jgi:tetratricopeptide (TPR) repeat protein
MNNAGTVSRVATVSQVAKLLVVLLVVCQPAPSHAQRRDKANQATGGVASGYIEQGQRLAEENKWAEAIEAFNHALGVDPRSAAAYGGLGDAYMNAGKWDKALASYKEAVRISPSDALAQYNLGYCYNTMGRHGEAFAPLVKATILDPGFAEAYYAIGYAYLRGVEYEKSISFLKSAVSLDPEYADAYYGLALVYSRLGKLDLAEQSRKRVLALDPKLAERLDREIRKPQIAAALPAIIRAEDLNVTGTSDGFAPATAPGRPVQTSPTHERIEGLASQAKANSSTTVSASEIVPQRQSVDSLSNIQAGTRQLITDVTPHNSDPGSLPKSRPSEQAQPQPPSVTQSPSLLNASGEVRADGPSPLKSSESAARLSTPGTVNAWPNKTKRWALVVGVDNYSEEQVSKLTGAANDARTLAAALIQYAGFPADQVILLSSDQAPQMQPRRSTILRYLSNLRGLVPKDGLLLVSFAGHGIERSGRSYLLPSDALAIDDPSLLEDTAINVSRVKDLIHLTEVTQVLLILDACRSDPNVGRGQADNPMTNNFSKSFEFDSNNRVVTAFATLYATAVGQRAYEYGVKKQGYFTWALVEGLSGQAANDKGEITLGSLMRYVEETVPKYVHRDLGPDKQQRPFAIVEGYKADELVVASAKKNAP